MTDSNSQNISDYLKLFLKNNLTYTLSFVFERSVVFLLLPFYTKFLSVDDYGIYQLFIATVSIGIFIYSFGIENSLVKFRSENFKHKNLDATIFVGMLSPAIFFTVLLYLFSGFFSSVIFGSTEFNYIVVILALTMFFETVIRYFTFELIGDQKSKTFFLINTARGFLTVLLNIVLIYYYNWGLEGAVYSYFITILILAISLILFGKIKIYFNADKELYKKLFLYSFPVMLTSVFLMFLNFADTYILKYFYSTSEVGLYAASYRLGNGLNMIIVAFSTAIIPFSLNLLKSNPDKKKLIQIIFSFFFVLLLMLFVIVGIFYKEIMEINIAGFYLIDPKFQQSIEIIPIIMLAYVFLGIYTASTVSYHYTGKTTKLAIYSAIAVLINIILNIIFIPIYSYWAAAFVTLISFLILSILTSFDNKLSGIIVYQKKIILTILVSIFTYGISYFYLFDNLLSRSVLFGVFIIFAGFIIKKISSEYSQI